MKPTRRSVLQAAAAATTAPLWPAFARTGGAVSGTRILGGTEVEASGSVGVTLSWFGVRHSPVARVAAMVDGSWVPSGELVADHGHGPADPDGREFGAPVLRPEATAFHIEPIRGVEATDLRVHRIDAGAAPLSIADTSLPTLSPIPGVTIIERRAWATRARLEAFDCALGSALDGVACRSDVGLRHAVIHHTVNDNDYAADTVPALLRGIQSFHMDTRGWDDIGYNFVVDRFGRIWQARDADVFDPIVGGHTLGFNAESVGVAVLGTFNDADPGQPVVDALAALLGWKCSLHGIDPLGSVRVRSTGNELTDFGEHVTVPTISGHRDTQATSCPGNGLDGRIADVRRDAAELVTLFGSAVPSYFDDRIDIDGWAINRFTPTTAVDIDITLDGEAWTTTPADVAVASVGAAYPDAGPAHGFAETIPITLDTRSITVTARALDDTAVSLMDLRLYAAFVDVEPERFYGPGVYFLRVNGLTSGKFPGVYAPMDDMTRAEMATFLWRFMGEPDAPRSGRFDDIPDDTWYTTAVDWLLATGITVGTSPSTFSPDDPVTRAQMATFLWRLCGEPVVGAPLPFADVPVGVFFTDAVRWMAALGITVGTSPTTYTPDGVVTRGEIATFLQRLATTPEAWTEVDLPPGLIV